MNLGEVCISHQKLSESMENLVRPAVCHLIVDKSPII